MFTLGVSLRRRAKIDANQPEIVSFLRAMGCYVRSTAQLGDGFPDLFCHFRGRDFLVEVKMPGEKLTDKQKLFVSLYPGTVHIVTNLADCAELLNVSLS